LVLEFYLPFIFCLHAPDARFSSLSGLPASPHLTLGAESGHADSTLRHCKDLTEQTPHHFSLPPSLSPLFLSHGAAAAHLWTLFLLLLARPVLGLEFLLARSSCGGGHGDPGGG